METSLTSLAQNLEAGQTKLERLESLVNASPIAMFICKPGGDFATTFVTEGVRTLWGYEPEDFLHQPGFWGDRIHPEDVSAVYGHLGSVLERERAQLRLPFPHQERRVPLDARRTSVGEGRRPAIRWKSPVTASISRNRSWPKRPCGKAKRGRR